MEKKSIPGIKLPFQIPKTEFIIDFLTRDKMEEAVSVITKSWLGLEPQVMWLKQSFKEVHDLLYNVQEEEFKAGRALSIVVTDKSGKIWGAAINKEITFEPDPPAENPIDMMIEEHHKKYKEYYKENKREGNVMEVYGVGILDEIKGKGVANFLAPATTLAGHLFGYRWGITEASNIYGSAICDKLGYTRVHVIKHDEFTYKEKSGEEKQPFKGMDAWFTALLNEIRPKDKQLTTSCSMYTLYEVENSKAILALLN